MRSFGEKTEAALREAAVALIPRHGCEAVSMRPPVAEIGPHAAATRNGFPAKAVLPSPLMHVRGSTLHSGRNHLLLEAIFPVPVEKGRMRPLPWPFRCMGATRPVDDRPHAVGIVHVP